MFLTGKYLNRNYSNWGYLNASEKTIGNVMKDAGYVTGVFGKWQLHYSVKLMQQWGWNSHILFELTEDTMAFRRYKNPVLRENGYNFMLIPYTWDGVNPATYNYCMKGALTAIIDPSLIALNVKRRIH